MHDLFDAYFNYTESYVRKLGVAEQDSEDVTSDILIRFYENGSLDKFQPELMSTHKKATKVRFISYLSSYVQLSVRGKRDRITQQEIKRPLLLDEEVPGTGLTYMIILSPSYDGGIGTPESWVPILHTRVSGDPILSRVLDGLETQLDVEGQLKIRKLAVVLDMPVAQIRESLKIMQAMVLDIQMELAA
jgi:hypothetical protein